MSELKISEIDLLHPITKSSVTWFDEPTVDHLAGMLQTAKLLELDGTTLLAIEHLTSTETLTKLSERIGEEAARLIKGYQALDSTRTKAASGQAETLRKMLLAFSQDLRVVLIYLVARLQTLRWVTKEKLPIEPQWAQEILEIDATLANRLGIWQLKWEMEDLAFRVLNPQAYQEIARLLDSKRVVRQRFVEDIVGKIQNELFVHKLSAEVYGRPKHIYSIWRKMQGKHLDFSHLYDVSAVRVIVDDIKACYTVLGIVHQIWQPLNKEFDDYIARPKPNGYQSLHTVVKDDENIPFEVQIRTKSMHHQAEYGVAAHWRYKEDSYAKTGTISAAREYERKVAWARQLIAWKEDAWDQLKGQAIDDQVYALTPLGRVLALEKNATPIDFAYAVHTNIGHRCRGAKVDGTIVPLDTILHNGQTVEIMTVKEGGPSRDWLSIEKGYLASHRARSKVKAWFNAIDTPVEKDSKGIEKDVKNPKELKHIPEELPQLNIKPSRKKKDTGDILIVGVDSLLTQLSKCCRPVPPDPINGFITRGRGISIHRSDCQTLRQLGIRAPERIIKSAWAEQTSQNSIFAAEVGIKAIDRHGLLRDISEVFSKLRINVVGVNTLSSKGMASMQFSIEIHSLDEVAQAIKLLMNVKGVTSAVRK
jgi:GTP pyrophosphokinase